MGPFTLRALRQAPPGPATLPVDPAQGDPQAGRLLQAARAGRWPAVRTVLAGAADPNELSFFLAVGAEADGAEEWLPDAVRAELDSSLAPLLYAARLIALAWQATGRYPPQYVDRDQLELFVQRLRIAEDCLQGVVRREPDSAAAWHLSITTARGLHLGVAEARRRFDRAVGACPGHLRAHHEYLQTLCPKWSGSIEVMHNFARTTLLNAPPGSPLGHLIAIAHLEEAMTAVTDKGVVGYLSYRPTRAALHDAADRSVRHPDFRPGRDWATVHGCFALAFALAGEHRAAAEHFRALGDTVTDFPWRYWNDGVGFCALRRSAYAAR